LVKIVFAYDFWKITLFNRACCVCISLPNVLRKINKNYLIIYKFAIIFNLIIKELLNLKNNKNIIILSLDQLYIYIYKK